MSAVLTAKNVTKTFRTRDGAGLFGRGAAVNAVDGVSLEAFAGETLAVVGESGCGKSTLAQLLLGLLPPTAGSVAYDGVSIGALGRARSARFHRDVQVVFQDPASSLNPRRRVGQIVGDVLRLHGMASRGDLRKAVLRALAAVELSPPEVFADRFPHELSGGQRQRVAIARAVAIQPRLIIADEPLSALDLSVQAQVLALMNRLKDELGTGYVLITHDLDVVRAAADRVIVMYLGRVVESGVAAEVIDRPQHPYTASLLGSRLIPDPVRARARARRTLEGDVPSPADVPTGCAFHPRCPIAIERCRTAVPALAPSGGRPVACHRSGEAGAGPALLVERSTPRGEA